MKKVCIINLGCKVNQYESESLALQLKQEGFEVFTKLQFADLYIINTCAVTNEAEHKSREYISKITKLNPNAKIYICGCSSELHPEDYLNKQNVQAIAGTENKYLITNAIKQNLTGDLRIKPATIYFDNYVTEPTKTRCNIKIQDGCNNFCSYCIIPYTRGRERSRPLASIKKEICRLSNKTNEIVLVGINIASYGKDLTPKTSLIDVVKIFKDYPHLRLRFSSFEMGTITIELLKVLKSLPNFCPFFHISLQSANNNVLNKMNRHYSIEDYINTITNIRKIFPNAGISTDIIVGFPTETDTDFEDGLNNIKKIKFSNIHIFPYSKREGTVAANYKQINGTIIKSKIAKLKQIALKNKQEYLENNLNLTHEVLLEELKNGYYIGFSKNYIRTYITPNSKLELNKVYKIKTIKILNDGLLGEVIGDKIWTTVFFVK